MLRIIVGTTRRRTTPHTRTNTSTTATDVNATDVSPTQEPWVDYIKRATATAEAQLHKLHIDDWPTTYLRRKWRWAARVATLPHNRWPLIAAKWQPQLQLDQRASRRQARPTKRWSDDFTTFLATTGGSLQTMSWLDAAKTPQWLGLETSFINHCLSTQCSSARSTTLGASIT